MWELITKAVSSAGYAAKQATKSLAAGEGEADLGLQSALLAGAGTRLGRFLYTTSLTAIAITWYSAYVNERTREGQPKFIIPGSKTPVINKPDRPNKTLATLKTGKNSFASAKETVSGLEAPGMPFGSSYTSPETKGRTLIAITPEQLGTPGSAVAGYLWTAPDNQKQLPPYNVAVFKELLAMAGKIGNKYGLKISSSYRPGDTNSLHGHGLAFDMVGSMHNMKRAASWAAENPGLFQEIFIHNEGSGIHLHLGMYPDAAKIFNHPTNRYNQANNTQSIAPAQSRATII